MLFFKIINIKKIVILNLLQFFLAAIYAAKKLAFLNSTAAKTSFLTQQINKYKKNNFLNTISHFFNPA
jgi:hypothetical protein